MRWGIKSIDRSAMGVDATNKLPAKVSNPVADNIDRMAVAIIERT
jgi:hypothetical protein